MPRRPIALLLAVAFVFPALIGASPGLAAYPLVVEVPHKGPAQIAAIEDRGLEVLALTRDGKLHVAARPEDRVFLSGFGAPARVLFDARTAVTVTDIDANLGAYRTYAETQVVIFALQAANPGLVQVFSIGNSIEGRPIWAVKVSDNVAVDESEPEVLFMGCHHARELMSVEIPLQFLEYLVNKYPTDPQVQQLVNEREIFFVPIVNPDGYVYVQNNHAGNPGGWWRKNRRDNGDGTFGVDLNRNYGYAWGFDDVGSQPSPSASTYRGTAPFSEPETQAVRDFCATRQFSVWLSYHTYGELFLYPWGYDYTYTTDHAIFRRIADEVTAVNGYQGGNTAEGAIYITNGGSDDWGYGDTTTKPRVFAFTPEVGLPGDGVNWWWFGQPESLITPYFDLLLPMNLRMTELAANPASVLGPMPPTLQRIGLTPQDELVLAWSANVPGDPNPAFTYEIESIQSPTILPVVDAEDEVASVELAGGFVRSGARAQQGSQSYYSSTGNGLSSTLTTAVPFTVSDATDTLTCQLWWDVELNWDYAYIEVSEDQGLIWQPVAGSVTTETNPYGNNRGHGITGASGGWLPALFPLDAYVGQEILLRVHYVTDGSIFEEGVYVDVLGPWPGFVAHSTVASGLTGTSHTFNPGPQGLYRFRIRGQDADGDRGDWSNRVDVDTANPTAAQVLPPEASGLQHNVPNPFNPRTWLPYTVGRAAGGVAHVELGVYDARGRRLAVLVNEAQGPGYYRVSWDGRADDGRALPSGHYFARLVIDGKEVRSRKLALIK